MSQSKQALPDEIRAVLRIGQCTTHKISRKGVMRLTF